MAPHPILLDLPTELVTERLSIRAPRPGTGAALNEAVLESLDSLRPWMPWAQRPPTVEENEAWIRERAADYLARRQLQMHLWCKHTGAFVGGSGFVRMDWSVPRFEIGYWCRDSFVGRGLVTEAVHALTAFAFDALSAQRVEIRCDAHNRRSIAVAERSGFTREGCLRHEARATDGSLRDTLIFSRIRSEHEAGALLDSRGGAS